MARTNGILLVLLLSASHLVAASDRVRVAHTERAASELAGSLATLADTASRAPSAPTTPLSAEADSLLGTLSHAAGLVLSGGLRHPDGSTVLPEHVLASHVPAAHLSWDALLAVVGSGPGGDVLVSDASSGDLGGDAGSLSSVVEVLLAQYLSSHLTHGTEVRGSWFSERKAALLEAIDSAKESLSQKVDAATRAIGESVSTVSEAAKSLISDSGLVEQFKVLEDSRVGKVIEAVKDVKPLQAFGAGAYGFLNGVLAGMGDLFRDAITHPSCDRHAVKVAETLKATMSSMRSFVTQVFTGKPSMLNMLRPEEEQTLSAVGKRALADAGNLVGSIAGFAYGCEPLAAIAKTSAVVLVLALSVTAALVATGFGVVVKIAQVAMALVFAARFIIATAARLFRAVVACGADCRDGHLLVAIESAAALAGAVTGVVVLSGVNKILEVKNLRGVFQGSGLKKLGISWKPSFRQELSKFVSNLKAAGNRASVAVGTVKDSVGNAVHRARGAAAEARMMIDDAVDARLRSGARAGAAATDDAAASSTRSAVSADDAAKARSAFSDAGGSVEALAKIKSASRAMKTAEANVRAAVSREKLAIRKLTKLRADPRADPAKIAAAERAVVAAGARLFGDTSTQRMIGIHLGRFLKSIPDGADVTPAIKSLRRFYTAFSKASSTPKMQQAASTRVSSAADALEAAMKEAGVSSSAASGSSPAVAAARQRLLSAVSEAAKATDETTAAMSKSDDLLRNVVDGAVDEYSKAFLSSIEAEIRGQTMASNFMTLKSVADQSARASSLVGDDAARFVASAKAQERLVMSGIEAAAGQTSSSWSAWKAAELSDFKEVINAMRIASMVGSSSQVVANSVGVGQSLAGAISGDIGLRSYRYRIELVVHNLLGQGAEPITEVDVDALLRKPTSVAEKMASPLFSPLTNLPSFIRDYIVSKELTVMSNVALSVNAACGSIGVRVANSNLWDGRTKVALSHDKVFIWTDRLRPVHVDFIFRVNVAGESGPTYFYARANYPASLLGQQFVRSMAYPVGLELDQVAASRRHSFSSAARSTPFGTVSASSAVVAQAEEEGDDRVLTPAEVREAVQEAAAEGAAIRPDERADAQGERPSVAMRISSAMSSGSVSGRAVLRSSTKHEANDIIEGDPFDLSERDTCSAPSSSDSGESSSAASGAAAPDVGASSIGCMSLDLASVEFSASRITRAVGVTPERRTRSHWTDFIDKTVGSVSAVCRTTKIPHTADHEVATKCMTDFDTPTCSSPLLRGENIMTLDGRRYGRIAYGKGLWNPTTVDFPCPQDSIPRVGVQCELRAMDGHALGAFRTSLFELIATTRRANGGFIVVPVKSLDGVRHPTMMALFGRVIGQAVVRIRLGGVTGNLASVKKAHDILDVRGRKALEDTRASEAQGDAGGGTFLLGVRRLASLLYNFQEDSSTRANLDEDDASGSDKAVDDLEKIRDASVENEFSDGTGAGSSRGEGRSDVSVGNVQWNSQIWPVVESISRGSKLSVELAQMVKDLDSSAGRVSGSKVDPLPWDVKSKENLCPMIFTHRGVARKSSPSVENTMSAFAEGAMDLFEGTETDVILVKDETQNSVEAVLMHDLDYDRLLGLKVAFDDKTRFGTKRYFALRNILSPCGFFPTLQDLLNFARVFGLNIDLDVKPSDITEPTWDGYNEALADTVSAAVREAGVRDQVVVTSFDPRKLRAMPSDIRTAMASHGTTGSEALYMADRAIDYAKSEAVLYRWSAVSKSRVRSAREKGHPVGVYTAFDLNDPEGSGSYDEELIKDMVEWGVTFIETDDPHRLRDIFIKTGCKLRAPPDSLASFKRISLMSDIMEKGHFPGLRGAFMSCAATHKFEMSMLGGRRNLLELQLEVENAKKMNENE